VKDAASMGHGHLVHAPIRTDVPTDLEPDAQLRLTTDPRLHPDLEPFHCIAAGLDDCVGAT
jgi:hypothetical protein